MSEQKLLGQLEIVDCKEPEFVAVDDAVAKEIQNHTSKGEVWIESNGFNHPDRAYEDDGFVHVNRGLYKVCFYNGQEENCWRERDVQSLAKRVEKAIQRCHNDILRHTKV